MSPSAFASWLIDHPAATYVIRVSGYSMLGAGTFVAPHALSMRW